MPGLLIRLYFAMTTNFMQAEMEDEDQNGMQVSKRRNHHHHHHHDLCQLATMIIEASPFCATNLENIK